ncbi:hypothetical protein OH77DRAFT_1038940 [Trametes cingulata]|nr:hypothetical protein OH77DRAFT_1038940 [Trametes cingulata]
MHPIQDILQAFLFWTQARYEALLATPESPSATKENQHGDVCETRATKVPSPSPGPITPPRAPLGNANLNGVVPAYPIPASSPKDEELTTAGSHLHSDDISKMLDSHNAFLEFLNKELARKDWPTSDKKGDQLEDDSGDEDDSASSDSSDSEDESDDEHGSGSGYRRSEYRSFDDADSSDVDEEASGARVVKRVRSGDLDAEYSDAQVALAKRLRKL